MSTRDRSRRMLPALAIVLAAIAGPAAAETIKVKLSGYEEVPPISSPASGEVKLKIDEKAGTIFYELSYSSLIGNVTQAHIHFAQEGVNGGISVWLCGTAALPGPAGTPQCSGTTDGGASGMLMAAQVIGPTGQQILAGEFAELLQAIRGGVTYANVHTTAAPGGEIRGQIGEGKGGHKH